MMKPTHYYGYRATTRKRALIMLAADVFGYLMFGLVCGVRRWRGRGFRMERVRTIAVFRLDGIGDLVLSASALVALRQFFPNARITLFVNRWTVGISSLLPGVDDVVELHAPQFAAFKGNGSGLSEFLSELQFLRKMGKKRHFDLGIDLRGDLLSILPAFCLGPAFLFSRSSRAGGFLLTNPVHQQEEGRIGESGLNVALVEKIVGKKFPGRLATLAAPSNQVLAKMRQLLPAGTQKGGYVCLAVAAPYEARCYSLEKWAEVLRLLRDVYSGSFLILGSAGERKRCADVAERCGRGVHNLAGMLSLVETAACIHGCRLFIGNDGGLIHIASAYQRPLVQLFGPASSVAFGHRGGDEHLLQSYCSLNPCAESQCPFPSGERCMDRIPPADVARAALPYLR